MSGIPTRRAGQCGADQAPQRRMMAPGQGQRQPTWAGTTQGRPQSGLRPPSGIPTSTPFPQRPPAQGGPAPQRSASRLQPPSRLPRSSSGLSNISQIPRSGIPQVQRPPPVQQQYPVGNVQGQRMGLMNARAFQGTGAIPKVPKPSAKTVRLESVSKTPRGTYASTTERTVSQGQLPESLKQPKRDKRNLMIQTSKMPQRQKMFEKTRQELEVEEDLGDGDEVQETVDWQEGKVTTSRLEQELEANMLAVASMKPKTPLVGTTVRKTAVAPPMMMTEKGPIPIQTQVITTKSVTKYKGQPDIIGRDITTIEVLSPCKAEKTEMVMSRVTPHYPGTKEHKSKEAIIVQSTIAIAEGYKQEVTTVTYDGDPDDVRHASVLPSPKEVAKLVREETAMINETLDLHMPEVKRLSPTTYSIRKKALGYSLDRSAVGELEDHELCATCITTPSSQEDPTPEMIVEMLNTEERGLAMGGAPDNVYNYLFAASADAPKIEVSSVAPFPFADVVGPSKLPNLAQQITNVDDVLEVTIQAATSVSGKNEDNTYCAVVGDAPLQTKNTARKGRKTKKKRVTLLAKEPPPWGAIEDTEEVIDVVGAPLSESRAPKNEVEEEVDPLEEGIEYLLQMEAPQYYSQVQMRGSQRPEWFPGFLMALPEIPNLVAVAKSPSEVFAAAWRATQPDIFNDDSLFIV